jgi:hypothetical protein
MTTPTTFAPNKLTTRQGLKDYCLRRLGAPVIEINVDDDQVEDRIQDAIEFYQEFHFDGTERVYLKSRVVASTVRLTDPVAPSFTLTEKIRGLTSGTVATVYNPLTTDGINMPNAIDPYVIQLQNVMNSTSTDIGAFVDGETITGLTSGFSATVATNGFTVGNWDQKYFTISDAVTGITRVFTVGPGTSGMNARNIFDVVYQFRLNDMYDLMSTDLIYYAQVKMHLSMLDMMLPGERSIRFNRAQNRLHVDMNWLEQLIPGAYIIAECYRILDPEEFNRVYNNYFIKKYATALIKRMWGNNMKKFDGVQLIGGVKLNGKEIYEEAVEEIKDLEEEMRNAWQMPPEFMIG